jgi:arsenite-transporting ATPase
MSGMMGLNANQEDMFGKLEGMRAIITEVNNQFKDPVSSTYIMSLISYVMRLILMTFYTYRKRQHLSVYVFPNSCLFMRLSV